MSLLLLFGAPVSSGTSLFLLLHSPAIPSTTPAIDFQMAFDQTAAGSAGAIDFQETLTFTAQGIAETMGRNSRESIEALETFTVSSLNSRESLEILYNANVDGLNSRESFEGLWQLGNVTALDSRLSIEILEGPVLNKQSWGFIPIT